MDSEKAIAVIAELVLRIETLETRRMDSLDFHEVAVWSVREALQQAYEAGYESGYEAVNPDRPVSDNPFHPTNIDKLRLTPEEMAKIRK